MKSLSMWKSAITLVAGLTLLASGAAQLAPKGQLDTIKVHGHWTIVIKNPDGSVASRDEFENSLFKGDGDVLLAGILGRTMSTGNWIISLDAGYGGTRPCTKNGTATLCQIGEPNGSQLSGAELFANLSVQVTGATHNQVTLSGSATSTNGGQVADVSTYIGACQGTVAPSSCGMNGSGIHRLTTHGLTPPITVQAGQSINVTVVVSFS